ncbi:MAG: transposase [Bacteroidales bacterium]|nr:transposase [Bacteroidales bacterium]
MSKVNALFHIVINTHHRQMTIGDDHCDDMYRYIWKTIQNKGCFLCRIGGVANHIHMLVDLKPTVALADLVREVKQTSSEWARTSGMFPHWDGWGREYAAFSISIDAKNNVIEYIKGQKEHHKRVSFEDEFKRILVEHGIDWDDRLLT